jgi:RibD C-terminal domain
VEQLEGHQGRFAEAVGKLKREPGELQVHGSVDLVQTLMRHDLVDEYRLSFAPVVLGTGKRLFREGAVPAAMRLVDTTTTTTGLVSAHLRARGQAAIQFFRPRRVADQPSDLAELAPTAHNGWSPDAEEARSHGRQHRQHADRRAALDRREPPGGTAAP